MWVHDRLSNVQLSFLLRYDWPLGNLGQCESRLLVVFRYCLSHCMPSVVFFPHHLDVLRHKTIRLNAVLTGSCDKIWQHSWPLLSQKIWVSFDSPHTRSYRDPDSWDFLHDKMLTHISEQSFHIIDSRTDPVDISICTAVVGAQCAWRQKTWHIYNSYCERGRQPQFIFDLFAYASLQISQALSVLFNNKIMTPLQKWCIAVLISHPQHIE